MMIELDNYRRYRWFYTSQGNLVIGGKSAIQNDELIQRVKSLKKEFYVMHTSSPGSPFCVVLAPPASIVEKEMDECAVFTGCFSRAWKEKKKKAVVDIFLLSQLGKSKEMKTGTWGVVGKVKRKEVELSLIITKQKEILRAVPPKTVSSKEAFVKICPGSIEKKDIAAKLEIEIDSQFSQEELLSALPAGGFKLCR